MSTRPDSRTDPSREAPVSTVFRFTPLIKQGRSVLKIDWDSRDELFEQMERREIAPV